MAFEDEYAGIIVKRMFQNGVQASDRITLVSGQDNQNILMAASKFFSNELEAISRKSSQPEFILANTDGAMLKAIVEFCHMGSIELTDANVSKYLAIAYGHELDLLVRKCWLWLAENHSVENANQTWSLANKYGNRDICQRALQFVCEYFEKIPIPCWPADDLNKTK